MTNATNTKGPKQHYTKLLAMIPSSYRVDVCGDRETPECPVVAKIVDAIWAGREMRALVLVDEKREIDACEIPAMLVGALATVSIGSDSYADKVAAVSASMHEITMESGKKFRYLPSKGCYGDRSHRVLIGFARDYRDPSF